MTKALIVIDMVVRDVQKHYDKKRLVRNQVLLMNAFRARKQKVILVGGSHSGVPRKRKANPVMSRLWGNEISKNPAENKVVPELLNAPHDLYIDKPEYSAFFKTKLEQYCKKHKITELYFCGIYTGCCVYFSAADAAMRGMQPYLVYDAAGSTSPMWAKRNADNFKVFFGPVVKTRSLL